MSLFSQWKEWFLQKFVSISLYCLKKYIVLELHCKRFLKTSVWIQKPISFYRMLFPEKEPPLLKFTRYNIYNVQRSGLDRTNDHVQRSGLDRTNDHVQRSGLDRTNDHTHTFDYVQLPGFDMDYLQGDTIFVDEKIKTFSNDISKEMQPREKMQEWLKFSKEADQSIESSNILQECILFLHEKQANENTIVIQYKTKDYPILSHEREIIYKPIHSPVDFLTIQYQSNKTDTLIPLHVPRDYFVVGNELFRPSFVMFLLDMQDKKHWFDNHYLLKLIDKDINMFSLGPQQSIVLLETGYKIVENDT